MAGSRTTSPSISLFPFLSILACIAGTLSLLVVGTSLGEMASPGSLEARTEAQEPRQPDAGEVEARVRDRQERIEALSRAVQDLEARLAAARAELQASEAEKEDTEGAIVVLPPRVRGSAAADAPAGPQPVFVECTRDQLILDVRRPRPQWTRVSAPDIGRSGRLADVLRRVAKDPRKTVIFLIRPGGVLTFDSASAVARDEQARHGFLPVPGQGRLDFSLLPGE